MPPGHVTVECPTRGLTLVVLADEAPATLGGGTGGTQSLEVPRQRAAVHWEGHPPLTLSVPLVLDGHGADRSVEGEIADLLRMGRAEPGEARPPTVRVAGPVPCASTDEWLVETIDWGAAMRRNGDPLEQRTRQHLVLNLVEDHSVDLVLTRKVPPAKRVRIRRKRYVVKKGDTLSKIAARLKVKGGWRAIAKVNGIRDPKRIKVNQRLKIPA